MKEALVEANKAYSLGEVPIGAVIVYKDEIIARAHNLRELTNISTAHAEILAIEEACKYLNAWRLTDCDIYVTIEPCSMCAGAIYQSRIRNLFFGAKDYKAGACGSIIDILGNEKINHKVLVTSGLLEKECSMIISEFFKSLRK